SAAKSGAQSCGHEPRVSLRSTWATLVRIIESSTSEANMTDWAYIRSVRFSTERPADWPDGVYAVSMKGVALLGVHEQSGKLYWDGKEVVTRGAIRLGTFERWVASFA